MAIHHGHRGPGAQTAQVREHLGTDQRPTTLVVGDVELERGRVRVYTDLVGLVEDDVADVRRRRELEIEFIDGVDRRRQVERVPADERAGDDYFLYVLRIGILGLLPICFFDLLQPDLFLGFLLLSKQSRAADRHRHCAQCGYETSK